jgi:hypothetical protein
MNKKPLEKLETELTTLSARAAAIAADLQAARRAIIEGRNFLSAQS